MDEIAAGIITGAVVGATIGAGSYLLNAVITGNFSWSGFGKSILMGTITGAVFGGVYNASLLTAGFSYTNYVFGSIISSVLPSWEINIGDFSFNISPSIAIGKGWGFGANVSATFHAGDFSYSYGFGVMYYAAHAGSGLSGWEYRKSEMFSYDDGKFGFNLGSNWWSGSGSMAELAQKTGIIGFRHGDFRINYENDGSILGLGDGGDSYRTAAVNLSIKEYSIGFNLFTGYRDYDNEKGSVSQHRDPMCIDEFGRRMPNGIALETGTKYRLGALYFGYKNYRIGTDSEHVRHAIQDQAIHNLRIPWFNGKSLLDKRQMGFENQSWNWKPYFQSHTKNKFTSW